MGVSRESSLRELLTEHEERHKRFLDDYRKKSNKLLKALLPNIETSTLRGLTELGFTFVEKLITKIEKDRNRVLRELEALKQHPILEEAGEHGYFETELAKLSGHYDNLQPFLKKCFQHPRFDNLLLDGYGSDKYKKRIWHLSYHIDRRAAREIEEMCGGRSFSSIRMEAGQALEASTVLKERIRALKEKRRTQASTLKRKRTLESRLESHTQVWLDSARRRLLEELEENPARIEKILALHPESGFEWRLAKELIEEHKSLKEKFLDEAHEALENGRGGRCDFLLMKYEQSSAALKRFDRPDAPKESIDWKSFLYQEPPKVEKPAAAPPNDGE